MKLFVAIVGDELVIVRAADEYDAVSVIMKRAHALDLHGWDRDELMRSVKPLEKVRLWLE